ncbi:hypothetical protein QAD02_005860 [Eretmocerus hayati]|uniref:Uncharacterized protein n=1 Tax=Eretmocerus hayati TaxID=131215 RepID=A0ACC2NUR8_9HYME|nr:hypothetical protein QAD02_005860 [Eretmocerus hayati]
MRSSSEISYPYTGRNCSDGLVEGARDPMMREQLVRRGCRWRAQTASHAASVRLCVSVVGVDGGGGASVVLLLCTSGAAAVRGSERGRGQLAAGLRGRSCGLGAAPRLFSQDLPRLRQSPVDGGFQC